MVNAEVAFMRAGAAIDPEEIRGTLPALRTRVIETGSRRLLAELDANERGNETPS